MFLEIPMTGKTTIVMGGTVQGKSLSRAYRCAARANVSRNRAHPGAGSFFEQPGISAFGALLR